MQMFQFPSFQLAILQAVSDTLVTHAYVTYISGTALFVQAQEFQLMSNCGSGTHKACRLGPTLTCKVMTAAAAVRHQV